MPPSTPATATIGSSIGHGGNGTRAGSEYRYGLLANRSFEAGTWRRGEAVHSLKARKLTASPCFTRDAFFFLDTYFTF